MRGKTSKIFGFMMGALLLAGCGGSPLGAVVSGDDYPIDAQARARFPYALGADISRDPGLMADGLDEAFQVQASLPEKVDLRRGCSPVGNQGNFGSCTSFATVKGLEEFLLKKEGRYKPQAPAYIWYQSRRQTGGKGQDTGVPTEFAVKMLDAYGSLPEEEFPYLAASKQKDDAARNSFLTRQPSSQQVSMAKKNRIVKGFEIATKLSKVRRALADGMPVVVAMRVFDSIGKTGSSGMLPMPTAKDKAVGGHAVLAVGYDNAKQVLIIRNSWGSDWADGGYFYMPYQYVKQGHVRLAVVPKI